MKKNTRNLIMILSMMFITIFAVMSVDAAGAEHHYKGDVNRDDKVDVEDVRMVQSFMTSSDYYIPKDNKKYADMNDDGKINIVDLMLLKRTAAGRIPIAEDPALTTTVSTEVTTTTETTVTAVTTEVSSEEQTVTSASSTTQPTTTVSTTESTAATTVTTTTTTVTSTSATTTTSTTEATEATTVSTSVTTAETSAVTDEDTDGKIAGKDVDRVGAFGQFKVDIGDWGEYLQLNADETYDIFTEETVIPEIKGDGTYTVKLYPKNALLDCSFFSLMLTNGSDNPVINQSNYPNLHVTVDKILLDGVESSQNPYVNYWGAAYGMSGTTIDVNPMANGTVRECIEVTITISGMSNN